MSFWHKMDHPSSFCSLKIKFLLKASDLKLSYESPAGSKNLQSSGVNCKLPFGLCGIVSWLVADNH